MKKLILTIVAVISFTACKKGETSESSSTNDPLNINADSLSQSNSAVYDSIPYLKQNKPDSVVTALKDTAIVKIQNLKEQKLLLTERVAKAMDSATKKEIIAEIKLTQQKIDSVKGKLIINSKKSKISQKIVERTKVIYRDYPQTLKTEILPKITKKGELEIKVDDFETAQYNIKEQIAKYDGVVKSEQIFSEGNQQVNNLKISVPLDKSNYLIDDLEENVGKITYRNIEITGQEYAKNSVCILEISLVNNSEKAAVAAGSKSFGGRTLGAVGSGWNVIQEIFLFLLPFWPLVLIGGVIYYFVKKRKSESV